MTAGGGPAAVTLHQVSGKAGLVEATVAPGEPVANEVPWELTLRNVGPHPITVTNPYEGASYQLINAAGAPVQVKAPPSPAKVHVARDPKGKLPYLHLAAATVDGKALPADTFIESPSFELSAGGRIVLSLAITASLDPSSRAALDHVPAGDYQLVVVLRVVITAGGERKPVLLRTASELNVAAA